MSLPKDFRPDFICTASGRHTNRTSGYPTHCQKPTSNYGVSRCILGTANYRYLIKIAPVTKSGSSIGCHHGTPLFTPQDHVYRHAMSCSVSRGQVKCCCMSFNQRVKPSLRACIRSWNICKRHGSMRHHWLITRVYCSSMTMIGVKWRGWPGISYCDFAGSYCSLNLSTWNLQQKIATSFIPWTTNFVRNPSKMRHPCVKQSYLHPKHLFLFPGICIAGAKRSCCRCG